MGNGTTAAAPPPPASPPSSFSDDVFTNNGQQPTTTSRTEPRKRLNDKVDVELSDWLDLAKDRIWVQAICVELAGGGLTSIKRKRELLLPAILLARLVYWLSIGKDGNPRAKPAIGFPRRCWAPGYVEIARQLGLPTDNRDRAKKMIRRAIQSLVAKKLIELPSRLESEWTDDDLGRPIEGYEPEDLRDPDAGKARERGICLTVKTEKELRDAGLLVKSDTTPKGNMVMRVDIRGTSANEAILLTHLMYWFVTNAKRLRVRKKGRLWLAKSNLELSRATGLTGDQIRHASHQLVKRGLIDVKVFKFNKVPTRHYYVNPMTVCRFRNQVRKSPADE